MARKGAKPLTVDLDVENHRMIAIIAHQTGETKTALLKRLIEGEHEKITSSKAGNVSNESTEKTEILLSALGKVGEDAAGARAGANKIIAAIFVVIKENYRMLHLLTEFFSKSSLLKDDQLINLGKEGDKGAVESFRAAVNLLANAEVGDVLKTLQKK